MSSTEEVKSEKYGDYCHGGRWFWKIPFIILGVIGVVLAKSYLVLLLWNALIPELFHGPQITFLQAVGVSVLVKLLVGFGHHGGPWGRHRMHGGWHHRRARWLAMSDEERTKLREEMTKRCGGKE